MRVALALGVVSLLFAHAGLGRYLERDRPALEILPALPSAVTVNALSFGDAQFLYRSFVLQLQNAGDTGGRFTPMGKYDITKVIPWLAVLQSLDPRSSHYTALAANYFSQKKDPPSLRLLVDFIDHDVDRAPQFKWFWQARAVAMARDQLKDLVYALALSRKLVHLGRYVPNEQIWMLQMEAVLLTDLDRNDEARAAMELIVQEYGARMDDYQKAWTKAFLDRLNKPLVALNDMPHLCRAALRTQPDT